jgi:hypothetical protein
MKSRVRNCQKRIPKLASPKIPNSVKELMITGINSAI